MVIATPLMTAEEVPRLPDHRCCGGLVKRDTAVLNGPVLRFVVSSW